MKDKEISVFFVGAVIVRIVGKWLKRAIKQPRPVPSNSYGMPSGRGVIVGYTATYFLLLFPNMSIEAKGIIYITSFLACYMKYYLREHSIKQLIAGLITGIILGYTAHYSLRYL